MTALQTPTPPRHKKRLSSATPAAVTFPLNPAVPNSDITNFNAGPISSPVQQENCADQYLNSPSISEPRDVQHTLLTENAALKEELKKLRLELQVVLDHSIESDQRLLQFTEEVFLPPPSISSSSLGCNKTQQEYKYEELEKAHRKIQQLEDKIKQLSLPCKLCDILKEETKNMIESLRCLEAENIQLKNSALTSPQSQVVNISTPTPVHNIFHLLGENNNREDNNRADEDFVTVKKKKRNKKKAKSSCRASLKNKAKKIKPVHEVYLSTKFSRVTILGDSHIRGLASLVGKGLRAGTAVSGICKPGAGLLDIRPNSSPTRDHCYVLMAGTNDVDAGREDIIFNHLEGIIMTIKKTSRVLVLPLTTRYDLDSTSPVHDTVRLVNNYMAELSHRHRGVDVLDISSIKRHHYTSHGLHLRASGKEVLANLIRESLACMTPCPPPQPKSSQATTPLPTGLQTPFMLPYGSYAEAAAQSTTPQHVTLRPASASEPPAMPHESCPHTMESPHGRRSKNFPFPTNLNPI